MQALTSLSSSWMHTTVRSNPHIYAGLAQLDRVTGYEPVGREFESLNPHQSDASPSVRMIAKGEYGDGPNRIGLGGLFVAVEAARNS